MVGDNLLTHIWDGDVEVCDTADRSPLAMLLDGVLSVPTVSLVMSNGIDRPMAFADSTELLPGLQLGDVLEEELGFEVPANCVILLEPAQVATSDAVSASDLGRDLGHVLTSVAQGGQTAHNLDMPAVFEREPPAMAAAQR